MKLYVDLIILYYIGFLYYKEYEKNLNGGFGYIGRFKFDIRSFRTCIIVDITRSSYKALKIELCSSANVYVLIRIVIQL